MNRTHLRRSTAAAAVLALSLTAAACGSSDDEETTSDPTTDAPAETTDAPADEETDMGDDLSAQVFGEACGLLPQGDDAGSLDSMVVDPVATAASTNPLLTTLTAAVDAAGLTSTLNSVPAATVFAPADDAFNAVGEGPVNELVEGAAGDPESPLGQILQAHVIGENLDSSAVVGDQQSLVGTDLIVEGDESGMTVSDGMTTANVLCGNIPTANATVYVIDAVLLGNAPQLTALNHSVISDPFISPNR